MMPKATQIQLRSPPTHTDTHTLHSYDFTPQAVHVPLEVSHLGDIPFHTPRSPAGTVAGSPARAVGY